MTARTSRWLTLVAGLAVVVGLPLAGKWARSTPGPRCALDGAAVDPLYRVRVVDARGRPHEFCCLRCAELWLAHEAEAPRSVLVTDEATGREVDAASAWFVRSPVITTPHTGNRIHAFADRADADRHAHTARGTVLTDSERPALGSPEAGPGRAASISQLP